MIQYHELSIYCNCLLPQYIVSSCTQKYVAAPAQLALFVTKLMYNTELDFLQSGAVNKHHHQLLPTGPLARPGESAFEISF